MAQVLLQENKSEGILLLTLNRPEAMNCFSFELLAVLGDAIREANFDTNLRCLIVTGAGSDDQKKASFSTGADLKERRTMSPDQVKRFIFTIRNVFTSIEQLRIPVIAAINGFAFGGGMELALACDLRIAAETAIMGLTETSLAIIPGAGGTQRLPRIVGIAKAKELIFTARRIDARTALEIGLVNSIAEPGKLIETALSMAQEIAQNGPVAVTQAKFAINCGMDAPLSVALPLESKAYEITIPTKDRMEALNAFAEKRKPSFRGE